MSPSKVAAFMDLLDDYAAAVASKEGNAILATGAKLVELYRQALEARDD